MRNILSLSVLILLVTLGPAWTPVAYAAGSTNPNQGNTSLVIPILVHSNNSAQAPPTVAAEAQPTSPVTPAPSKVPAAKAKPSVRCPSPYTVRRGDTLSAIARRCGVTITNLLRWNNLRSDAIRAGQRLITRPPTTKVSGSTAAPRQAVPTPAPVAVVPTSLPPARTTEPTPVPPAEPTPTPRLVPTVEP